MDAGQSDEVIHVEADDVINLLMGKIMELTKEVVLLRANKMLTDREAEAAKAGT